MFHHYLVPGFRGGFVGVDVFFVISGFLIAAHIDRDIAVSRFSLLAFYERRIRRILPALAVMYALFLVLAYKVYFPPELHFQTRLAAYVIPFLANYVFYKNAGTYGGEFAGPHRAAAHLVVGGRRAVLSVLPASDDGNFALHTRSLQGRSLAHGGGIVRVVHCRHIHRAFRRLLSNAVSRLGTACRRATGCREASRPRATFGYELARRYWDCCS